MSAVHVARHVPRAVALLLLIFTTPCLGFETPTHRIINRSAVESSVTFHQLLRDGMGLIRGVDQALRGLTILDWIGEGGVAEDQLFGIEMLGGLTRSTRHFHTPLLGWEQSGLSLPPLPRFESSVRWAQSDQGILGRFAWSDARTRFFDAATGRTEVDRQKAFADTFLTIGQLMHLVADLAQPAHARDESHALGDDFEKFMADPDNDYLITGFQTFDPSILQVPTNDPVAKVPVAHIWDTNRYNGTNPPDETTAPMFGLAEISNANFFSPGTIRSFAHSDAIRPLPALNLLDLASIVPYVTGENRQYRGKSGSGLRVERMVAEGVFYRFLPPFVFNFALDDGVFREYAGHLLPRAIGYAAGLLEYFFRGRIEIAPPARFAYGLAAYQPGNSGSFRALRFRVRNATPGEDTGPGQLIAVAQYRESVTGANLIDDPFAPISAELSYAVSKPFAVTLTPTFQELTFDFGEKPIPSNVADLFLTVVYRGRLGLEDDAVMVGGKDLFEPAPIDMANATDWECFQGGLHHVADLTAYPPYGPGQTARDVNHDGVPDLAGPFMVRGQFLKTFDFAEPGPGPSESNFDLSNSVEAPTQYSRVILLQDRPTYGATVLSREIQAMPSGGIGTNALQSATVPGVFNDTTPGPDGTLVRRVRPSTVYRGVPLHFGLLLTTSATVPCISNTGLLPPSLTRIDGIVPSP